MLHGSLQPSCFFQLLVSLTNPEFCATGVGVVNLYDHQTRLSEGLSPLGGQDSRAFRVEHIALPSERLLSGMVIAFSEVFQIG